MDLVEAVAAAAAEDFRKAEVVHLKVAVERLKDVADSKARVRKGTRIRMAGETSRSLTETSQHPMPRRFSRHDHPNRFKMLR